MPKTREEIERRMDELALEYGRAPRGEPRRKEIAEEMSDLRKTMEALTAGKFVTQTALNILEDAVHRCASEDVSTPEVLDALDILATQAKVRWPVEQFREALTGEPDVAKEGRRQVLSASLNGIKRVIPRAS